MSKFACNAGCSYCCYSMSIPVFQNEFVTVVEAVKKIAATGTLVHEEMPKKGNKVKSPCALLDVATGKCRIYEDRPLVCRGYRSRSVEKCKTVLNDRTYRGIIHNLNHPDNAWPEEQAKMKLAGQVIGDLRDIVYAVLNVDKA